MAIELGSISLEPKKIIAQLRFDMKDDFFQDPLAFGDMFAKDRVTQIIETNFIANQGAYKATAREIANVPKSNFTLRCALETGIADRALYHGLTQFLIPFYDPLLDWHVFSFRYNNENKKDRYIFSHRIKTWKDFIGNVRVSLKEKPVLLSTDLANYFEHVNLRILKTAMLELLPEVTASAAEKGRIRTYLDALFECLKEWSFSEVGGLPQNRDASSFLANMYLLCVDRALTKAGYTWFRYMDDIKITCSDEFEARKALKELSLQLRKLGLSVNSGKTEICHVSEVEKITRCLGGDTDLIRQLGAMWETRKLVPIRRTFPQLRTLTETLLEENKSDSREFRFCIARLELMARCKEFAVPDDFFLPITTLILGAIPKSPAATDQFVKYLRAVSTPDNLLSPIADYLMCSTKSVYTWQNYKLWLLLAEKNYRDDALLDFALQQLALNVDNPGVSGGILYAGVVGDDIHRIEIAKSFKSIGSFLGQRSAIIAVQSIKFSPHIKTFVQPFLRHDLKGVYRDLRENGLTQYFAPAETVSITSLISQNERS